MQVKNYASKHSLELTDVLETLKAKFSRSVWSGSSQLKDSHISLLNQTFQVDNLKLPSQSEIKALPQQKLHTNQINEMIANDSALTHKETSELGEILKDNVNQLTVADVQELQQQAQITDIEETAVHHAVEAFQVYQSTYEQVTRGLILSDVNKKQIERMRKRREFEQKQNQVAEAKITAETSQDTKSEILNLMKADNYASSYLNNILGGL